MEISRPRSLRSLLSRFTIGAFGLYAASVAVGGTAMYRTWAAWEARLADRSANWVTTALMNEALEVREGAEERAYSDEATEILRTPQSTAARLRLLNEEHDYLERRGFTALMLFDAAHTLRYAWTADGVPLPATSLPDGAFTRMDTDGGFGGYLRLGSALMRVGGARLRVPDGDPGQGYIVLGVPVTNAFLASLGERFSRSMRLTLGSASEYTPGRRTSGDSLVFRTSLNDIFGAPVASVRTAFDRSAARRNVRWGLALFAGLLVFGIGAASLVWAWGYRLWVQPLLNAMRVIESMRGAKALHELSTETPVAEWEVLRTAFNDTVRSLSEYQRRYRDVFDRAADALFLLEPGSGRVIDANPATAALTGVSAADIIGQTLPAELVPGEAGQRVVRWRRGDGVTQTWGVAASEIAFDGATWMLAAYRDLTGREAMAHAQRMEAVGSLAGGIAHDFNNLMGAVLTGVTAARTLVGATHPAVTALDGIEHAGTRAAELTRQLLNFSRHDPLRLEPVDVAQVVRTVGALCERTFDARIVVDAWAAADLPAVLGDPGEFEQALLNLCINARDARPPGGSLRLEAQRLFLDATQARTEGVPAAGTYVEVAVGDTGTGISDEVKSRLFEPFFTTKAPGHGTGLGLSLVYGLARQLGGAIAVQSVVGRGTRVRLLFPALAERPAASVARTAPTAPLALRDPAPGDARPVILLVDDERALREMLRMVLDLSGFQVLEAADGTHALAQFGAHRAQIRAILLDVQLPGAVSGVETLERLRALDADVPVVLCTGFVRDDDLARMRAMSVEDVLLKPVDINALLVRLDTICGSRQPVAAG